MAEKVVMLALSPTMETGTIVKWNKREGEEIATGEVICEVETDKATMEYEAVNEGTLLKIVIPEGGGAAVGQTIAVVGEAGEDISGLLDEVAREKVPEPTKPAEPERAASEETTGSLQEAAGAEPSASEEAALPAPDIHDAPFSGRRSGQEYARVKASPLAKKLADQYGIVLNGVQGSGPGGRIIKRDIEAVRTAPGEPASASGRRSSGVSRAGEQSGVPTRVLSGEPPATEELLSGKRKVIAERLSQSKFSAPHYYLKSVIAVDGLMAARSKLNKKRSNDKLTFNGFIVKFVAEALRRHPAINSSWKGDRIVRFERADIGIAVAQPDGLVTPILRDCWNRGIEDLDAELKVLIEKARNNKLKPDEYTGATFTISSLGTYGIHEFTAIINPPGSAILAVGQARREPVVDEDDEIRIRTNMTVTLSCDHRVIDGAEGAFFLNDLREMIENPVFALYR